MIYNKAEYEKLIDSSVLFSLDKEKEYIAYRREALKMVEYLYCYLMAVNPYKYEPYGVEIVEVAKRCIEGFEPSSGRFLNYFMAAWKSEYRHLLGKELVRETFKGIHFTEEEERNYRKYMILARNIGIDTEDPDFDSRIADAMGLPADRISSLRIMAGNRPVDSIYSGEDGKELDLLEQIDSGEYADTDVIQRDVVNEIIDLIEGTFDHLQERQKPMLSMLITSKLSLLVINDMELKDVLRSKSFFDKEVYDKVFRSGTQIQAKEIAERFGVSEASISRSWKVFKTKLGKRIHR